MNLKAIFRIPRVNFTAYQNALKLVLSEAITDAAFAWLGATTAQIPVWSGASLATFRPLAQSINFHIDISPVSTAPNQIDLGLSNSTGKVDVGNAGNGKVSFNYGTSLAHLVYNEFNNANITPDPGLFSKLLRPGPYDFQTRGLVAFKQSIRNARLPDPTKNLSITAIRVP